MVAPYFQMCSYEWGFEVDWLWVWKPQPSVAYDVSFHLIVLYMYKFNIFCRLDLNEYEMINPEVWGYYQELHSVMLSSPLHSSGAPDVRVHESLLRWICQYHIWWVWLKLFVMQKSDFLTTIASHYLYLYFNSLLFYSPFSTLLSASLKNATEQCTLFSVWS